MKKIILLIVLTVALSSCVSRLKITVEVANRDQIVEEYQKKEVLPNLLSLENFVSNWNQSEIINEIYGFIEKPKILLDPMSKNLILSKFNNKINPYFNKIKDYTASSRIAFDKNNFSDATELNNQANFNIQQIFSNLSEFDFDYKGLKGYIINSNKALKSVTPAPILGTPRTKFPLLGDPLASFVSKEEDEHLWESVYNKTVSWNIMGNADVAVILRNNPPENELKSGDYNNNFSIKGVRLDTSDAVNTILTSLTQTINFVANTNGIPLKIPSSDSENQIPTPNSVIANSQSNITILETKKRKLIDYRKMLIDKIKLENIEDSNKSTEEIKASSLRIAEYWSKIKTELIK